MVRKKVLTDTFASLKIMSFNSRSLCNKTVGVCEFLTSNECDVCFVTESWIKMKDTGRIAEIKDLGYQILFKPRKGKRGGGVCVLFKEGIDIEKCKIDKSYKTFEILEVVMKSASGLCRASTFYRTGKMSVKDRTDFINELDDYLICLTQKKGQKILLGDFNIHVENNDLDTHALYSITESFGFSQLINTPTHQDGGMLDLVFIQNQSAYYEMAIDTLVVHDLEFSLTSDHCFIEFSIPFTKDIAKPTTIDLSYRDYANVNIHCFCRDVEDILKLDSQPDFFSLGADSAAEAFNDAICTVIEKHAPMKNVTVRKKKNRFTNNEILSLRRQRRKFERRYRKYGSIHDKTQFTKLKHDVEKLVKSTRNKYYKGKLSDFKGNKKETFKVFNELLGNDTKSPLPCHENESQLCNDFEKFFSDKICNIRNNVQYEANNIQSAEMTNSVQSDSVFSEFSPMTDDQINKIVHDLSNKYCNLDPLSTDLFKKCLPYLLPYLKYIINTSLSEGIFPSCYKKALVRPSLKNSSLDKDALKNYRPISNICFFSKVIERCVLEQLTDHLESNDCLGEFQSAYRKHHSCETAITKVSDDILCSLDDNQCSFLLFLDLSAAFDTVDHSILLSRLMKAHNICGVPLSWFQSYLTQRSYSVKIGKCVSNGILLLFGVPQGSILGPILFILYISEIENIAKQFGFKIHIYADDTQLYISFKRTYIYDAISDIEHCLRHIKKWMSANFLKLNEDKTKCLLISPTNYSTYILSNLCISFSGSVITPSLDCVNLGVTFDNEMSMHTYINSIVSKGYYHLGKFWNVADKLTVELKLTLITSYILPLIDYCNVTFLAASKMFVDKLQKLLNSAVRFIFNLSGKRRRLSITPYLKKVHVLPVKYRMKYKISLLVYKCFNDLAPVYIKDLIKPRLTYAHMRSDNDLYTLQTFVPNTHYGESSFSYIAPVEWNSLPQDIRLCPTIESFKKQLKSFYYIKCFGN